MNNFFNPSTVSDKVFSVKEINESLKKITASLFSALWIEGEISSINFHQSGNTYLNLKDSEAVIDAIIFRSSMAPSYKQLKVGDKVKALGGISVYVKGGRYSFNIRKLEKSGKGDLYEEFLKLKEKLEQEGLFEEEHKKPLPFLPKRIGVITSPTGAAFKDILTVSKRRFPSVDFILFPAQVQGEESAQSIIDAITAAELYAVNNSLDVLIIGRGGGSYDELFVFNNEKIARKVFETPLITVSSVGHERDFTILDFVADKRAATPSHAAEIVLPDKEELKNRISYQKNTLDYRLQDKLNRLKNRLETGKPSYLKRILEDKIQNYSLELDSKQNKLNTLIQNTLKIKENQLGIFFQKLEKLNPLYILKKNYSISYKADGKIINSVNQVQQNDEIQLHLKDGALKARVCQKIQLNESQIGRFIKE